MSASSPRLSVSTSSAFGALPSINSESGQPIIGLYFATERRNKLLACELPRRANTAWPKILAQEFGSKGEDHHPNNPAEHPTESRIGRRTDGPIFCLESAANHRRLAQAPLQRLAQRGGYRKRLTPVRFCVCGNRHFHGGHWPRRRSQNAGARISQHARGDGTA